MTPDPQLLTKQVIVDGLDVTGVTTNVRFNLQRGKIARIWGFSWNLSEVAFTLVEFSVFVRKTAGVERAPTPSDNLWAAIIASDTSATGWYAQMRPVNVMFPKPHRTSGITVQMHASTTTNTDALLIIYYDIDDVAKGELVQRWEKSRQKKYDRRMLAP